MKEKDLKSAAYLLREMAEYTDEVGPRDLRGTQKKARELAAKLEELESNPDYKAFLKKRDQ